MGENFSGNKQSDFRVKTKIDDPQSGYLKEKIKAAQGSGIIINEVDGEVGKVLELNVNIDTATLNAKLEAGANIQFTSNPLNGKTTISAPDVGKVKIMLTDPDLDYLENKIIEGDGIDVVPENNQLVINSLGLVAIKEDDSPDYLLDKVAAGNNITIEEGTGANEGKVVISESDSNAGMVKVDYEDGTFGFLSLKILPQFPVLTSINTENSGHELNVKVADKLVFSQFNDKLGSGGYDDYTKSFNKDIACIYGEVMNDGEEVLGVNFCSPRTSNNPFMITIKYKYSGNVAILSLYTTSNPTNWISADYTRTEEVAFAGDASSEPSTVKLISAYGYAAPLYFLLVCDQAALTDDFKIFDIYITEMEE